MADVGDQQPNHDAPTTPFRKIVVPADETVVIPRPPGSRPSGPQPSGGTAGPPSRSPQGSPPHARPRPGPPSGPQPSGPQPSEPPATPQSGPKATPQSGPRAAPQSGPQTTPRSGPLTTPPYGARPGRESGPQAVPPSVPHADSLAGNGSGAQTGGAQAGAGAATRLGHGPGPASQQYPMPPVVPPPPPGSGLMSRIGDIPIRVVYLVGAIIATVVAVLLIFAVFSGDVPKDQSLPQGGSIAPPPAGAAKEPAATLARSAVPSSTPSSTGVALPPVPAAKEYAVLPGTASVVIGLVSDPKAGLSYPRLGLPWKSATSAPFSVAQRAGKAAVPGALIGSAPLPGATPAARPVKDSDYRKLAARAATWALGAQYPAGATLTWTGSERTPLGKGWTLAFRVAYDADGGQRVAQGLVSVVDTGRAKPAMLFASVPESGKSRWRDLNTIADRIAPI
ncbi:hypothetical protein MTP10_36425 [Nonomuraea sp. 3-1Str]|nr:hypothetical protein [Nonomuraea sp. 3-1Str]